MMKRMMAAFLAAMLLLFPFALAIAEDDGFSFDAFDDGYDGEWVSIGPLGIELCLPEGWSSADDQGGATYAASKDDGSASLSIRSEAEGVTDLKSWAEANLKDYSMEEASFYDALLVEDAQSLTVRITLSDERLVAFEFARRDAEALPTTFALQIVGSTCELWDDDDAAVAWDDEDIPDFGEVFEEA